MNIVFIITDITTMGGIERTTLLLAEELVKRNYQVENWSCFKKNERPYFNCDNITIKYITQLSYELNDKQSNRLFLIPQLISLLFSIRKLLKYSSRDSLFICQCFLPTLVMWLNGFIKNVIVCEHFKYELYTPFICKFRNWIYKKTKQVVTLTREDEVKYKKYMNRVSVIPNMSPFNVGDMANIKKKRIITVGRLSFQKGYDLLLQSVHDLFDEFSDWSLDIYGDGELLNTLLNQRDNLGLQHNVHFNGYSNNIKKEMLESSIFVMSSRFEGLPMVLLEAMSCGLPIVSFDCPEGPKTLLSDDVGLLIEAENINLLNSALRNMMSSYDLRLKYQNKVKERALLYTADNVVNKWKELFYYLGLEK